MSLSANFSMSCAAIIALFFVGAINDVRAQTWDGGGSDNNFGTGQNWAGDALPGVGTNVTLTFGGGTRTNPYNNYTAFDDFGSWIFAFGAGTFNISGNAIDLGTKIENQSTNLQTVSILAIGAAGNTEFNPVSGTLVINVANIYNNGNQMRVYGTNGNTVTFSNSVISGTGTFAILQNSVARFMSAMTYSGDTFVSAGTLRFSTGGSANSSTIRLGDTTGSANATLLVNEGMTLDSGDIVVRSGSSGTKTITTDAASGTTATISRNVYLDAGLTVKSTATGGTLLFNSSTFDIKSQTLAVTDSGNVSISSALTSSTSGGNFTKAGVGTLTLSGSGANTFVGSSTVSEGVLVLNKSANTAAIDGSLTINSGATLRTDAANQLKNELVTVNGVFDMNSQAQSFALAGAGTVTMSATLTNNNTGTDTFSGQLTGSGALVKTNSGTLILSGSANDYTGGTLVTLGTLQIGNGATTGSVAGAITNNATLAFNRSDNLTNSGTISGTGKLTKSGNGTVTLSGASYSGGTLVSAGGLQGSTASLQGNITNNGTVIFDQGTNGSYAGTLSGSGGVNKAGAGAVTFTTENTYSGGTVVNSGTLTLNASSGSAAKNTASVTVSSGATLLISASDQVTNSAAVTLSGGTISRGSGVSETFGTLNLTAASFLSYGSVSESKVIQFGSLSMGGFVLGVTGFAELNQLAYTATTLADGVSKLSSFTFDNSYTTSFSSNTFTITAIPEPTTYVAAVALLAVLIWPSRRRLIKDAKSILGLRASARHRLAH